MSFFLSLCVFLYIYSDINAQEGEEEQNLQNVWADQVLSMWSMKTSCEE